MILWLVGELLINHSQIGMCCCSIREREKVLRCSSAAVESQMHHRILFYGEWIWLVKVIQECGSRERWIKIEMREESDLVYSTLRNYLFNLISVFVGYLRLLLLSVGLL